MRSVVDERLRGEARRFGLVHTCDRCAHFEPDSGGCANGYPNAAHRRSLEGAETLEFCKEFELA